MLQNDANFGIGALVLAPNLADLTLLLKALVSLDRTCCGHAGTDENDPKAT
jgi:hypothetical protein